MSVVETVHEWHQMFLDDNVYGKDDDALPFLIVMGALINGANKRKIKRWLDEFIVRREEDFEEMWKTALKNKIFYKGKIVVDDVEAGLTLVELVLDAGVLKGLFERVPVEINI